MDKVVVEEKLSQFSEHWNPKVVGELNGQMVKLVKFQGDFMWHHHDAEDEMFYVLKGHLIMKLRDGDVTVDPGEFIIIPRGVEHMPCAPEEVHVMLFEPASTLNTGNLPHTERTREKLDRL